MLLWNSLLLTQLFIHILPLSLFWIKKILYSQFFKVTHHVCILIKNSSLQCSAFNADMSSLLFLSRGLHGLEQRTVFFYVFVINGSHPHTLYILHSNNGYLSSSSFSFYHPFFVRQAEASPLLASRTRSTAAKKRGLKNKSFMLPRWMAHADLTSKYCFFFSTYWQIKFLPGPD